MVRALADPLDTVHLSVTHRDGLLLCCAVADPQTANLTDPEFMQYLRGAITTAGGQLIYGAVHEELCIDALPNSTRTRRRMSQYSPYNSRAGRAVLRIWKAREWLYNLSLGVERARRAQYSLVLWTRDDALWLGRAQLCPFKWLKGVQTSVYARNCLWQVADPRAGALAWTVFRDRVCNVPSPPRRVMGGSKGGYQTRCVHWGCSVDRFS